MTTALAEAPATSHLWLPRWHTALPRASEGAEAVDFAHSLLRQPDTSPIANAGDPLRLSKWQQWCVNGALALDEDGFWSKDRAIIGVARRNGKSFLTSTIGLYALILAGPNELILAAAGDRQQARIIFNAAKWQVENSPALHRACKVTRDAIIVKRTGAIWRTVSSDSRLVHGLGPKVVTFDELHVQRDDQMWSAFTTSGAARREQLIVGISTAGNSLDSLLGGLYLHGQKVCSGEVSDPGLFFAWWEPHNAACELDDITALEQANPSVGEGLVLPEKIISNKTTLSEAEFRRYHLNQWSAVAGGTLVSFADWARAERRGVVIEPGADVCLAFDGSLADDATALMAIGMDSGVIEIVGLWEPHGTGWKVDRESVNTAIARAFARWRVRRMFCDVAYWQFEVEEWAKTYGRTVVVAFPMTNARMGPATSEFLSDLTEQRICHNGDKRLARHVLNAMPKLSAWGDVPRKDSPGSPRKIDALVATIMATEARRAIMRRRGKAGGL